MIVGVSNQNISITVHSNTGGLSKLADLAAKLSELAVIDHLLTRDLRRRTTWAWRLGGRSIGTGAKREHVRHREYVRRAARAAILVPLATVGRRQGWLAGNSRIGKYRRTVNWADWRQCWLRSTPTSIGWQSPSVGSQITKRTSHGSLHRRIVGNKIQTIRRRSAAKIWHTTDCSGDAQLQSFSKHHRIGRARLREETFDKGAGTVQNGGNVLRIVSRSTEGNLAIVVGHLQLPHHLLLAVLHCRTEEVVRFSDCRAGCLVAATQLPRELHDCVGSSAEVGRTESRARHEDLQRRHLGSGDVVHAAQIVRRVLRAHAVGAEKNVARTARKLELDAVAGARRTARHGAQCGARHVVNRAHAVPVKAAHETMCQLTSAAQQCRAVAAVGNHRTLLRRTTSRTGQSRVTVNDSIVVPQCTCTQITAPAAIRLDTTCRNTVASISDK